MKEITFFCLAIYSLSLLFLLLIRKIVKKIPIQYHAFLISAIFYTILNIPFAEMLILKALASISSLNLTLSISILFIHSIKKITTNRNRFLIYSYKVILTTGAIFSLLSAFKTAPAYMLTQIICSIITGQLILELYWNLLSSYNKLKSICRQLKSSSQAAGKELKRAESRIKIEKRERYNHHIRMGRRLRRSLMLLKYELSGYKRCKDISSLDRMGDEIEILLRDALNLLSRSSYKREGLTFSNRASINLSRITSKLLDYYREAALVRKIKLESNIHENIFIKAPPEAIELIINNLLANALKYTALSAIKKEKSVVILLKASRYRIFLSIRDNGPGFSQNSGSQGLRLGLKMVKSAVTALNGELIMRTREGVGTNCKVVLNRELPPKDELVISAPAPPRGYLENITPDSLSRLFPRQSKNSSLLYIGSDKKLLFLLAEHFSKSYNIEYALNSSKALEKMREEEKINIIIFDIETAIEKKQELLKEFRLEQILVLISPFSGEKVKRKLIESLNPTILVEHPFDPEKLYFQVLSLTKIGKKAQGISSSSSLNIDSRDIDILCRTNRLTAREKDILYAIIEGKTIKDTAKELCISIETVKKYRQKLFTKLNVKWAREIVPKYFK